MSEWNGNRLMLINWCGFYYNTFIAAMEDERPPSDLINKDALLDEWLDDHRHRQKALRKGSVRPASQYEESFEEMNG